MQKSSDFDLRDMLWRDILNNFEFQVCFLTRSRVELADVLFVQKNYLKS